MTERDMRPNQEISIRPETQMKVGAAMSNHVVAKDLAASNIDQLRQEETMQRVLGLASTREGLAALIEASKK